MIIKDVDAMIALHEEVNFCEVCGDHNGKLECHHIWSRGMGGGQRLDIGWNLIIVCLRCHNLAQTNKIAKRTLWGIAAEREIYRMLRS